MTDWVVGAPTEDDRARWDELFAGYADFYGVPQDAADRDRVWGWLHDPAHELRGLVARGPDGVVAGITHFRPYARPLLAGVGCFLDDLFVDPAVRRGGVGAVLIEAVRAEADRQGWGAVRWITSASNERARSLYDRVATATSLVTYEIPAAPRD